MRPVAALSMTLLACSALSFNAAIAEDKPVGITPDMM